MEKIQILYDSYKKDTKQNQLEIKFGIYEDTSNVLKTGLSEETFWDIMKKIENILKDTFYNVQSLSKVIYEKGSIQMKYDKISEPSSKRLVRQKNSDIVYNKRPTCIHYENSIVKEHIYRKTELSDKKCKSKANGFRIILKKRVPLYLQLIPSSSEYDNIYNEVTLSYRVNQEYFINFIKKINIKSQKSSFHIQILFIKSEKPKISDSLWDIVTLISKTYN